MKKSNGILNYLKEITIVVIGVLVAVFISNYKDHLTQITIKVSPENVNQILQTFRRYGYEVVSAAEEDSYLDNLKERSDYLNKYLNI